MALKPYYRCVTLTGNTVEAGIRTREGAIWVYTDKEAGGTLASSFAEIEGDFLTVAAIGRHANGLLVIDPNLGDAKVDRSRILVLVHEYTPGSGSKRYPSFYIDWENVGTIEVLAKAYRSEGSGSDKYTLVLAPADWAANIAGQFVNERDTESEKIGYVPVSSPSAKEGDDDSPMAAALRRAGLLK